MDRQMSRRNPAKSGVRLVALALLLLGVGVFALSANGQQGSENPDTATPATSTPAADTPAATSEAPLSNKPLHSIGQLFGYSPIINGIIVALSGIALMLFLIFMLTINSRTMAPPGFVDEVVKLAIRGDYERAADVCRRSRGVFAAGIVQRCVENAGQTHGLMLEMIDTEGRRQADVIWNRVSYLADIANVAPMLGLLGTVLGMLQMFTQLESTSGGVMAQMLAGGIGKAMSTTMFGLAVGIFTMMLYTITKSRATRTLADAEQAVHMIVDHLKRDDSAIPSRGK